MSSNNSSERLLARAQAVDEEYAKLSAYFVDKRRIVLINDGIRRDGGFGVVRKGELYQSPYLPTWLASRKYGSPKRVAVKQIRLSGGDTEELKRAFTKEMIVWSSLGSHPGVCQFLGYYADFCTGDAWLISSWEPNGNVSEFVRARKLEIPEKLSLIHDTLEALTFLHQLKPPVCHGDIKSPNVLVSASCRAVFCDFGLARLYDDPAFGRLESTTRAKGSIRWCSPEVVDGGPRNERSDIYSWAWLTWEIMTGEVPYEKSKAEYAIIRQIFESSHPSREGKSHLTDCIRLYELMTRCWEKDPVQRPTAIMCKATVGDLPRCKPAPPESDGATRSPELLVNLAVIERWKGNYIESFSHLDEALRAYESTNDASGIAWVFLQRAIVLHNSGDSLSASAMATISLTHYTALSDDHGTAEAAFWYGWSMGYLDRGAEALPTLNAALERLRAQSNDFGVAKCLEAIGDIQRQEFQTGAALSALTEALDIQSRLGDSLRTGKLLQSIGLTHLEAEAWDLAETFLVQSWAIGQKLEWADNLVNSCTFLGLVRTNQQRFREAEECYQEAISISRLRSLHYFMAQALRHLGDCHLEQDHLDAGADAYEASYHAYQHISTPHWPRILASRVARQKSKNKEWDAALLWHERANDSTPIYQRSDEDYLEERGDILLELGRIIEAKSQYEAAIELAQSYPDQLQRLRRKICSFPVVGVEDLSDDFGLLWPL